MTVDTCVDKIMELEIIVEINKQFLEMICSSQPNMQNRLNNMCIIDYSNPHKPVVRMANLCVVSSHTVNGVALLHNKILKDELVHNYYSISPEQFQNKTNGITPPADGCVFVVLS